MRVGLKGFASALQLNVSWTTNAFFAAAERTVQHCQE
jgi:hypothetical protein